MIQYVELHGTFNNYNTNKNSIYQPTPTLRKRNDPEVILGVGQECLNLCMSNTTCMIKYHLDSTVTTIHQHFMKHCIDVLKEYQLTDYIIDNIYNEHVQTLWIHILVHYKLCAPNMQYYPDLGCICMRNKECNELRYNELFSERIISVIVIIIIPLIIGIFGIKYLRYIADIRKKIQNNMYRKIENPFY